MDSAAIHDPQNGRRQMTFDTRASLLLLLGLLTGISQGDELNRPVDLPAPFTAIQFQKHAAYLASDELAGRAPGSQGSAKAAKYIISHFEKFGLKPLQTDGSWFQQFPLTTTGSESGATAKNILAVLPGHGDLQHEAVVVCAHYDHLGVRSDGAEGEDIVFNGADDNASGVSALLLIAQALGAQEQQPAEPRRTVLFISFDIEERGLRGARYYVQHPLWPLAKTAAVINFDGMGRLRMGKVFASDAETSPMLAQVVRDAARSRQIIAETRFGGHGRSDHAVFLDRGIPGMHFFTGAHSDYHEVTDEWERLNSKGGAEIAWLGHEVVRTAVTHPDSIEYQQLNPIFNMTFALNLLRTFGIVPVVSTQDGRYPQILLVVPGSAAEKQGLRSGDQITAANGLQIKRVEDGLTIFQQLDFENGVRLAILRDGSNVDVSIPASIFEELSGPKSTRLESGKYEVFFSFKANAETEAVYLAGEFNDWKPTAHRMDGPDDQGLFTTRLKLNSGIYEYKFVVDGKEWTSDPQNLYQVGKYNNSVLWVGTPRK